MECSPQFSQWFQILSLFETLDNTDTPLFKRFLGIHTLNFSVLCSLFGAIFFSVSLTFSCYSFYPLNVTETFLLFSFFLKIILSPCSQQPSPCRWQKTPISYFYDHFASESNTCLLLMRQHGQRRF